MTGGKKVYSNEDLLSETNAYYTELHQFYYSEGMNKEPALDEVYKPKKRLREKIKMIWLEKWIRFQTTLINGRKQKKGVKLGTLRYTSINQSFTFREMFIPILTLV